ncbi:MAG TPA: hypothetical protein VJU81_06955 [Methylomirabilota bacterium]|nr:hypothetical protein [Methylomirabilota bacterium]
MALRGSDRMEEMELEPRGIELVRTRRPWALIIASLLLVVLVAVLWAKWSGTRSENERLRAELKVLYMEAEAIRTQAALAQQRIGVLEKQLGVARSQRPAAVLNDTSATKPAEKPKSKPATRAKPR